MSRYAQHTKVPISRSKGEVEATLNRYGASSIGTLQTSKGWIIAFEMSGRKVRLDLAVTDDDRENCRKWRVLLIRVKSKLEAIADGDATFDEEFMPYILLPNGDSVAAQAIPAIEAAYGGKVKPKLLEW